MIIYRFIQPSLLYNLKVSPIVFLNGARQAGKSTLVLNHLGEIGKDGIEAVYITFDNATQMVLHLFLNKERCLPGNPRLSVLQTI